MRTDAPTTQSAVLLAAGAGTRMQKADPLARLDPEQEQAASEGAKAMMPMHGRPFLDYALHALAEVGVRRAIVVRAPHQEAMQAHYDAQARQRIQVEFVVQEEPRGTAHALLSAEDALAQEPFLLLNGDNGYPVGALRRLAGCPHPALVAFAGHSLRLGASPDADGPLDARLCAYAGITQGSQGQLTQIVEKPEQPPAWVSMNAWRLPSEIFAACRAIPPSPRGEWELPDAVRHAMTHGGQAFRVLPARGPVLDLSTRRDIQAVSAFLQDVEVHL